MGSLLTRLSLLRRYFKIRFFVLSVIFIISSILLPLWVPYVPDFEPAQSIYTNTDTGHSNLLLDENSYQISQNYDNSKRYAEYDLVILINPQVDLPPDKQEEIREAQQSGVKVLLIGKSSIRIFEGVGQFYMSPQPEQDSRIFDPVNNGGEIQFPEIIYQERVFHGVVPTSVDTFRSHQALVTRNTAGFAGCYDDNNFPCLGEFTIGFVNNRLGVIADNWLFSNQFTNLFPENIELFWLIVNDLIGTSGDILFEESFLEWAPLNVKGVHNFIEVRLTIGVVGLVLFILTVILPLFVGVQARVFDNEPKKGLHTQNIEQRLNYLHIERLPAAPLNALENILITEKIQLLSRGKYYIQYIAHDLLEIFHSEGIMDIGEIQKKLFSLTSGKYSSYSSWRVLEEAYEILLSQNKPKK